ncbi:MAG: helix-turn-helix transcriptional regulator [Candidatus Eremiobacteraeota bacterium]|nr:helix-turn-helix transcriptional regulator [Candidatus Eremiobacteraeota bacterium]MCW5868598.1 helix-turn-helix transcriptional regulator [Candidatus Eremiobacteraeota bacterium]
MSYLLKVREKADLKQAEAARQMGVSRQFLARLEQGQSLPSADQAGILRGFYGVPVLESAHLLDQYERRRDAALCPYAVDFVDPTPWKTTHEDYGYTLEALGLDPALWQWMSSFLPADAPRECFALGQVAALGARPMLGNPNRWDFVEHVVVDHLGRLPGCRVFPGLIYESGDTDLWLWPQMRLRIDARYWFRLDGLVGYRKASRRFWLALEWDGAGRDLRRDAFRSERLGMLEVRITNQEIKEVRTTALLFERIEAAISAHLANPGLLKTTPPRLMRVNGEW